MEHGSDDPEIVKSIVYFTFALKFGFKPWEVDKMSATTVDEFLVMLKKHNELNKGGDEVDRMFD